MRYSFGTADYLSFYVMPSTRLVRITLLKPGSGSAELFNGRSSAVKPDKELNLLRVELCKDTARVVINGQEVRKVQHERLARRDGTLQLVALMSDKPADGQVDARFDNFRVYGTTAGSSC